jgi:hypothetical protein
MSGKVTTWTPERVDRLIRLVREHIDKIGRVEWQRVADECHVNRNGARIAYQKLSADGHAPQVSALIRSHRDNAVIAAIKRDPLPPKPEQEVETKTTLDGMEARAHGSRIKTVDDLLRHINADMTKYEVASCEATKYEMGSKGDDGEPVVTELHRVFVRLKPKAGPTTQEVVGGIIQAAFAGRRPLPAPRLPRAATPDILQLLVLADPHHGKHAWGKETGWGDYDLDISTALQSAAGGELIATGNGRKPARRMIALLGDYYHYDGVGGLTTKGTPQDRDSRVQKMIDDGARALFDLIDQSAEAVLTDVILVPGNHDQVLSWALQRILQSHYRASRRVTVDAEYTGRKYQRWGKVLLGLTHGEKARKRLPQLMARERPEDWGETTYREIHTGHFHEAAAIETIDGVITRTAPSLSAPDAWHAEEGFVGSLRAMETFYYHRDGALLGMDVAAPRVKRGRRLAAA